VSKCLKRTNILNDLSSRKYKRSGIIFGVIKILRNFKSKLQIPLNQEINKVVISTSQNLIDDIEKIKTDISNTIRIKKFEIIDRKKEKDIKTTPELQEYSEDLNLTVFFFK